MYSSVCFIFFQRNISQCNQHVLPPLISAMGCLARDDVIRHTFAHDPECWKAFLFAIVSVIIRQVSSHTKMRLDFGCMRSNSHLSSVWTTHLEITHENTELFLSHSTFYGMKNVSTVIPEALQCMWTQRRPLPFAWFDYQPFGSHFSSHSGQMSVAFPLSGMSVSYGCECEHIPIIFCYLNNRLCSCWWCDNIDNNITFDKVELSCVWMWGHQGKKKSLKLNSLD